ncbi:MAG: CysB family HTH-type transcriptional regulator [Burkholderiaceae bacterium]|jgi:LysR family cys regulon transcriptional activator
MNIHQLRFMREAVRRNFNLTDAAKALFTSQPGVSKAIIELEDELGVQIFQRHGKRLKALTEPGQVVYACVEKILAELENLKRIGQEFAERETGELRIAATHTQARYVLPPVVAQFRRRYPQVRLILLQGTALQLADWVRTDQADLAIATEDMAFSPELVTLACYQWEHIVVVPPVHPLLGAPLSLKALSQYPLITYDKAFAGRAKIDAAFAAQKLQPEIVLAGIDADLIKTYVSLGLGVGIIAAVAFDAQKDAPLARIVTDGLFGINTTRVGIRQGVFMRTLAYDFIQMFAPALTRKLIDRALAGGQRYDI